jgi:hypothetical protein
MGDRYFTAAQLAALERTPRQELEASLEEGPGAAEQVATSIARS